LKIKCQVRDENSKSQANPQSLSRRLSSYAFLGKEKVRDFLDTIGGENLFEKRRK